MKFIFKISINQYLTIGIGVVYLWFGMLKFFSGVSPAEELAQGTIDVLTFGLIPSDVSIILLAIWESLVGVLFLSGLFKRFAILFALLHIILTFTPICIFPELIFLVFPFQLTLLGQYVFKNIIIIASLLVLYKLYFGEEEGNNK